MLFAGKLKVLHSNACTLLYNDDYRNASNNGTDDSNTTDTYNWHL